MQQSSQDYTSKMLTALEFGTYAAEIYAEKTTQLNYYYYYYKM